MQLFNVTFAQVIKYDHHIDSCTDKPGYTYNFNTKSLITFEENLKYKSDIPLTAYIDFETTALTDDCLDPENAKLFAVSYVIIFTFHPELEIDKVVIERSFGHSEYTLTSLNYLTVDQLNFKNNKTLLQLRDCALNVARKKSKLAIAKMFTTELKFAGDCLLKWFNKKYKSKNLELSNEKKRKYEVEFPIDWENGRCCLYKFPLIINLMKFDVSLENMPRSDFIILKEHKFLRNIFSEEDLLKTKALRNIEQYHLPFQKFLTVSIFLEDSLNNLTEFHECCNNKLIKFCIEKCEDCDDFNEMKEAIKDITIKNKQGSKISKFVLQIYAFVYQRIMDFQRRCFDYETLKTNDLFDSVHKIINVKAQLHHSQITGNIIGYTQNFCNAKVRENKDMLTCIAHK